MVDRLRELIEQNGEKFGCSKAFDVEIDPRIRPREVSRRIVASRHFDAPILKSESEVVAKVLKWSRKVGRKFKSFKRQCWFCLQIGISTNHPAETHHDCQDYLEEKGYECDDPQRLLEHHILTKGVIDVCDKSLPTETLKDVRLELVKYTVDCF